MLSSLRGTFKFKLAILVYKSLHSPTPNTWLKTVNSLQLPTIVSYDRRIPHTYTHLSDWAFPVARPRLWNSLPSNLRQSDLPFSSSTRR